VKVKERFVPIHAANVDRARLVRSLLSLAVVGTLLLATLVPLPGLPSRQKNALSPSVALRDWERRDGARTITWAAALQAAKQVRARGGGFFSVDDPSDIDVTIYADMGYSGVEDLGTDQQRDDASRP
jgi:hypothetical protein